MLSCSETYPPGEVAEDGCRHSFLHRLASFLADSRTAVLDDGSRCLCQNKVDGRGHQLTAQLPGASLHQAQEQIVPASPCYLNGRNSLLQHGLKSHRYGRHEIRRTS